MGNARLWDPHSRDPAPGLTAGEFHPPFRPSGLTVKYARNGGSVDAKTEGGDGFAVIALVVRHSPLREKAEQGPSCRYPLHSRGSPWDRVLQGISIQVSKRIWGFQCLLAADGGTLRLFCPREGREDPRGNRTGQQKQPQGHRLTPPPTTQHLTSTDKPLHKVHRSWSSS